MELRNFEDLVMMVKAKPMPKRIVVAAAHDQHSLEAVFEARRDRLASPILVGDAAKINKILDDLGESLENEKIINEPDPEKAASVAVNLARNGYADVILKGKLETSQLLKAVVNKELGIRTAAVMSHIALFSVPRYHKLILITDGGMILHPSVEQKKELINNAVDFLISIGYQIPKVAVLAAAETVNAKMQDSLDAAQLKAMNQQGNINNCIIEGPVSFDLAMVKLKAEMKGYNSPVAGDADILVTPDLTCGNVLGKSLIEMAGASMAGLILGAKVPIVLNSRAASSEEKYLSICLAAASKAEEGKI